MRVGKQKAGFRPKGEDIAERLDALNARARAAGNASNVLRRTMESRIEVRAKRRRKSEGPASSNWKRAA